MNLDILVKYEEVWRVWRINIMQYPASILHHINKIQDFESTDKYFILFFWRK